MPKKKLKMPSIKLIKRYAPNLAYLLPAAAAVAGWQTGYTLLWLVALLLTAVLTLLLYPTLLAEKHLKVPSKKSVAKTSTVIQRIAQTQKKTQKGKKPSQMMGLQLRWFSLAAVVSLLVGTALFTYLALFVLPAPDPVLTAGSMAIGTNYLAAWLAYLSTTAEVGMGLAFLLILVVSSLAVVPLNKLPNQLLLRRIGSATAGFAKGMLLAFCAALGVSIIFTSQQLARVAHQLSSNPKEAGILLEADEIATRITELTKERKPLELRDASQQDPKHLVYGLAENTNRSPFFNQVLLRQLPASLQPAIELPNKDLLMVDQLILVRRLNQDTLQTITPALARHLVVLFFDPRNIKAMPDRMDIIGRQEYLQFRDEQINQELADIDREISSLGGQIAAARSQIGRVISSFFQGSISIYDAINQLDALEARIYRLQGDQARLRQIRTLVESQKDRAPRELGLFIPANDEEDKPQQIKVVLEETSPEALGDYLAIAVHEYLHYASHIDDERWLPLLFEEGLTEYYTRQIVSQQAKIETEVGYPLIVRMIQSMMDDLKPEDVAEIYFSKDEELLQASLDEAFGEDFYADSEIHFLTIPFSYKDEALKLANDVIEETGGKPLTEAELDAIIADESPGDQYPEDEE